MGILSNIADTGGATSQKPKGRGIGGVLSSILDVAMYGPFAGRARENRALRMKRAERAEEDADLDRQFKLLQLQQAQTPKPHYFQTNDGSQAAIGPDGQVRIIYQDPTPKTSWITADNPDGTKMLVPTIGGIPQMGNMPPRQAQPQGFGTLPQGFTVRKGGSGSGPTGFPGPAQGSR